MTPAATSGAMLQSEVFMHGEGDAWFARNTEHLAKYDAFRDPVMRAITSCNLTPKVIIDYGCASGERLSEVCFRFQAEGIGIDASTKAISRAKDRDTGIAWHIGDVTKVGMAEHAADLAIVSYVLHWVDRSRLFAMARNIDHALKPGGHLVINDFWPEVAMKRRYHHRADVEMWTWKRRYCELFIASGLYSIVYLRAYPYDETGELAAVTVLRKCDP